MFDLFRLALLLAIFLLKALDWYTTARFLAAGTGREANAITLWLLARMSAQAALPIDFVVTVVPLSLGAFLFPWPIALVLLLAAIIWLGRTVYNNWQLLP